MSSLGPLSAEAILAEPAVSAGGAVPEGGEAYHSGSAWRMIAAVFLENRLAIVGLGMIIFVTLFSFVGPFIYRTQQVFDNPNIANHAPSLAHPLGTDALGYDVLGRIMLGGQSSLEIGFAAALIAIGIGVVWGAASGLAGGIIDTVMMRIVDAMLAIPFLFALIVLGAIFTTSILELIIVIGLVAWLVPARLVRGETLSLRVREYVQAVRVMGGGSRRVLFRHIIPNTVGTIVVNATFQVADAIIAVATLSYLGLGVSAPATNWGGELNLGLNYIFSGYWWTIYPAGLAIVLTVVAFNFVGDAMRDALEVRLQRR
ncbi:MAG TPA: ABC transporter permease [Candidatus Dormibacteraeota bacterium]|nr:ABC transporter permease [Candidatus Dormibacteraeota bacterium]